MATKTDAQQQLINNMAELIAALAVEVSIGKLRGKARAAWTELHSQTVGFGWADADQYAEAIGKILA